MVCFHCGTTSWQGQKFCHKCGNSFASGCANCGALLPADAQFCGECGTPVPGGVPVTPDGVGEAEPTPERRLVSVLFADMVGFTPMSESKDPEEIRDLLSRYFVVARDVIERYGGTVDKFIGDAVMGVWGSPIAHEDDAERSVRAGLDLVREVYKLGVAAGMPDLQIRVGVATGEAAVLLNAPGQGMIVGDLVNTASRVEGAAEPGTVFVNEGTYRAARMAISFESVGDLIVKGKSEPVSAWRAIQVIAKRRGEGRAANIDGPFVGRDSELELLKDLFRSTIRNGRAQLVSVVGIAGIGKSRLVWELEKHLDGLSDLVYWHQGRSPSYGDGITFWALGEMVRRRANIAESDSAPEQARKLTAAVEEFIETSEDQTWVLHSLETLLGLREQPAGESSELFAAWRMFFEAVALKAPVILVFEDLQWADAGMIDFIESLLSWSRQSPLFVLATARPELMDRRPTWGAGQRSFTALQLDPLEPAGMSLLLKGLAPGLPDDLVERIVVRAEGVPLYAVETVRMLLDRGLVEEGDDGYVLLADVGALAVPETLHALVASRLDGLGPGDRRLLQRASVLGQMFAPEALSSLVDGTELVPRLDSLVRRQLLTVDQDPRSPERGQYGFIQAVIREVAYSTLSHSDRRQLHLQVAEYFDSLDAEELLPAIAHHVVLALDATPESARTDVLVERAGNALDRAAVRAASLGSHDQELGFLEHAMDLTRDPGVLADLSERAAVACQQSGFYTRAEPYFRRALDYHESTGDSERVASTGADLADTLMMSGRIDEAGEVVKGLVEGYGTEMSPRALASMEGQLARTHTFKSEPEPGLAAIERSLVLAAQAGDSNLIAHGLVTKGWALALSSRALESVAVTRGGLWLSVSGEHWDAENRARNNLADDLGWSDPYEAFELCRDGMTKARRLGDAESLAMMVAKAGWGAAEVGDWDWALEAFAEVAHIDVSSFSRQQLAGLEASIRAFRGESDRARDLVEGIANEVKQSEAPQDLLGYYTTLADLAIAEGDDRSALEFIEKSLALELGGLFWDQSYVNAARCAGALRDPGRLERAVVEIGEIPNPSERTRAWHRVAQGWSWILEGRVDEGLAEATPALEMLRKRRLKVDVAIAQTEIAGLLPKDHPTRAAAASEAREIWSEIKASASLDRLEEKLTRL